jgi:large subunit ribosomal protein L47
MAGAASLMPRPCHFNSISTSTSTFAFCFEFRGSFPSRLFSISHLYNSMASKFLTRAPTSTFELPLFLAPAFAQPQPITPTLVHIRSLSSTSPLSGRRQNHRKRGTDGKRKALIKYPRRITNNFLPKPVANPDRETGFYLNPNHGLWGFFDEDRKAIRPPDQDAAHGRSWTYEELTAKNWEDLHKLWWTCILEINRLKTRNHELKKLHAGYGGNELLARMNVVSGLPWILCLSMMNLLSLADMNVSETA